MRLFLIVLFFQIIGFNSYANEFVINELDLRRLIQERNALVSASNSEVEGLDAKTGHLGRSFVPKVSIGAGQESFKYVTDDFTSQPYYGASAEFNLYNGGRDSLKSKLSDINFERGKSIQKITLFDQLEKARKTFWRAIYLKNLVSRYSDGLKVVSKNKKAALRRIKSGVATQSDKYEFEIKEVEFRQDQKRAQLELEREISHLKVLLEVDQDQKIILNQELVHDHDWKKFTKHSEKEHNYLIKPYEFDLQKDQLQSKLANRKWFPKLNAYALWLQNNQRNDFDRINKNDREQTAFGIKAVWNFSDIVAGNSEAKSSGLMAQAKKMRLRYEKSELESELHMELKELELLDGMVHDAEENIERSKKFFKLISGEYKRGVKTSGDMLMATEKLIASEIRKMKIIKDFHLAKAHIMTKLGE